jgi:hypothetical protein
LNEVKALISEFEDKRAAFGVRFGFFLWSFKSSYQYFFILFLSHIGASWDCRWSETESPKWKATLWEEVCGWEQTSWSCGGCCESFTRRVYGMFVSVLDDLSATNKINRQLELDW